VVGDGHLGIWGGLAEVYPEAEEQRCWNHRILNVLNKLPKKRQAEAKALVCPIPYAPTRQEAEKAKEAFQRWCRHQGFNAAELLDHDFERMVAFYRYPKEPWIHLRTTNPIESPFPAVRLRTNAAKRFKKVDNATALIWKSWWSLKRLSGSTPPSYRKKSITASHSPMEYEQITTPSERPPELIYTPLDGSSRIQKYLSEREKTNEGEL